MQKVLYESVIDIVTKSFEFIMRTRNRFLIINLLIYQQPKEHVVTRFIIERGVTLKHRPDHLLCLRAPNMDGDTYKSRLATLLVPC